MGWAKSVLTAGFLASAVTAAHAQDCGGDFEAWRTVMTDEARAGGVGEKGLDALSRARIDQGVLKRDRAQGVFTQTFIEFAGRMISGYRLKQGAANLKKYGDVFARTEAEFGVQPAVIAAFWALETDFGANQGDFNTLNALVTLAHDCRRPHLFRPQVTPLLTLIDTGVLPEDVTGAWAGEIGQTQILPSDYLTKGIDADGNGVVDLRNDEADVIMTTGNKLKSRGWKAGQPWIEEVRVPDVMPWELTGRTNRLPISQWAGYGVTGRDGEPLHDNGLKAGLVLPQGHKGPAFFVYDNYDVYLEWNQSFVYTLTAANLAARLAGAPKFDPRNPEPGLSPDEMKLLQKKLEALGYDVGKVDGVLGANTREAVRQEQMKHGFPVDGWPTPALLARI